MNTYTGMYYEYFPNSNLIKSEVMMNMGIREGPYNEYYESQDDSEKELSVRGYYLNNLKHGEFYKYAYSKCPYSKYVNGICSIENYINGKKNGISVQFHENGNIHFLYTYQDDLKHGYSSMHNIDGTIVQECYYNNDNIHGERKSYWNGRLIKLFVFVHGKLNGISQTFWDTGELKTAGFYINGLAEGEHYQYYPNGEVSAKFIFVNGEMHGICSMYSPGIILKREIIYQHGKLIKVCEK
jgi:antitoxin component YwqK of YwqJK toxin-antitoxin module